MIQREKEKIGDIKLKEFQRKVSPYLYKAYFLWQDRAQRNIDNRPSLINLSLQALLNITHDIFPVAIEIDRLPTTLDEYYLGNSAWADLLSGQLWQDISPEKEDFPPIAEFGTKTQPGVKFLPAKLELPDIVLIRRYHRFILPDRHDAPWNKVLADFLAPRYKDVSDMQLKEFIARKIFELIGVKEGVLLDVGCGVGYAQIWRPSGKITLIGVDLSERMVEKAREKGEDAMVIDLAEPGEKLSGFPDFDGAILSYFDNWPNSETKRKVYGNIFRKLKLGARIALNIYQPGPGWKETYEKLFLSLGYSKVEFRDAQTDSQEGLRLINFVVAEK